MTLAPRKRKIKTIRCLGDLPQQRFIKPRFDDVARVVLYVRGRPFLVLHAEEFAFRGANANRENPRPALAAF